MAVLVAVLVAALVAVLVPLAAVQPFLVRRELRQRQQQMLQEQCFAEDQSVQI